MLGNGDNFLFQDSYGVGYAVARQSIGTGDGSDDTWQLYQTVTSGSTTRNFDRWDIIAASVSVWVNNALQTEGVDYNLDYSSSGLITFIAGHIPGAVAIEAAFSYYRRCRFTGSLGGILRAYNAGGMQLTFAEEGI
jgi:uncharacterized protein (TIGR02217 family)